MSIINKKFAQKICTFLSKKLLTFTKECDILISRKTKETANVNQVKSIAGFRFHRTADFGSQSNLQLWFGKETGPMEMSEQQFMPGMFRGGSFLQHSF